MIRSIRQMRNDPLAFLNAQWRLHGDLLQFPIPRPATYLLSDPADVRQVLVERSRNESKRTLQYDNLALLTGDGLLTADDPPWRERRRVIQPSFHHSQLGGVSTHTHDAVDRLLAKWWRLPDRAVVDVDSAMMTLALEVVAGALFGSDWRRDADDLTRATVIALDCVVRRARNPLPIPLAAPTPDNLRFRRARSTLDDAVLGLIRSRVSAGVTRATSTPTLADHLIDGLRLPNGQIDVAAVRDELVTFLVAGHETVASALTWTWHCLAANRGARDTLWTELDSVAYVRTAPTGDLPYTAAVIDEVLRLYPSAWVITRKSSIDLELRMGEVPKGALLIISPWIVHRHPSVWDHPTEFRPERFLGVDVRRQAAYLPFGLGPRMCIGRDFALVEAIAAVSRIAHACDLQLVDGQRELDVDASVTLRPKSGLRLRMVRRTIG